MTRARDLSRFVNAKTVDTSLNVGIGTTIPRARLDVVGVVSATSFYGDGTNLSNTGSTLSAASGTERVVLTNLTSGTMTASSTDANVTYNATTQTLSVPNVSIAGTLTYEDVTNVDSVGLITARNGAIINAGTATTALIVEGDARVTGILTIGTSSITLDGTENQVNVGTGVTLHHTNGVQVGENAVHSTGLTINNINSTGILTATTFRVGTGVTINESGINVGVITATTFNGNGSALTDIVAASASALNSTGISTVHTLYHPSQSNPLIVSRTGGQYVIHISDSGDDATGNGSSGSPYRTVNKALSMMPDIINKQSIYIKVLGGSYTHSSAVTFNGLGGAGAIHAGQCISIGADSATTFNMNTSMSFNDVEYPIEFFNLNFVTPVSSGNYGFFLTRCKYFYMRSDCTWTSSSSHGWSYGGGGIFTDTTVDWRAAVSLTSSASAGLGGVFVFDSCARVNWNANLIKSGTRFGNHGISVLNGTWFTANGCTISNFNQGIYNGINHYNAETGGHTMLNGVTLSNCGTGLILANGAVNRAYSITYSSNGTNISSSNSFST